MRKTTSGFTIIEVLVVVAIIGVLTTVGFVSYGSIEAGARDSKRSSQITVISEALEKYYDQNGEYPGCGAMADVPETIASTTLKGIDPAVFTVPDVAEGTNSFLALCADLTNSDDKFAYVGDGSDACTTGSSCMQYVLKYREESTGNTISVVSRRTVFIAGEAAAPSAPVVAVTSGGSGVLATITPVTCAAGATAQYEFNSRTNDGIWSGYTTWSTDLTATRTAAEGTKYGYRAQARCYISNFSYSTNATGDENTYIEPLTTTPAAPTVTATTTNYANTTFSWNAVTCTAGATPRYQYDFTTSYGFDFGWVETVGNSVNFTTSSFDYTYTVQTKAQCYNNYSSSAWGPVGSASYYRPIPTMQVLVVAGGGAGGASSSDDSGGGGGGGGVLYHSAITVDNQSYSVTIGNGGSSSGSNGQNSTFQDMIAYGGGGGGMTNEGGNNGGCGGGGAGAQDGSENNYGNSTQISYMGATPYGYRGGLGQWRNDGKAGGGGGGAGMIGGSGYSGGGNGKMTGGNGMQSSISGANAYYAGGGGGGSCCYWGAGGAGGGGNGAQGGRGSNATANTGGGGGGGSSAGGGNGGSGIIILRYPTISLGGSGGSSYTNGSDTIMVFRNSGTFTVY